MARGQWEHPLAVPGAAPLSRMTWGHPLGTTSDISLSTVAWFPLLEQSSRLSLSLSVSPIWGCWEPVLPRAAHPRSLIIYWLN